MNAQEFTRKDHPRSCGEHFSAMNMLMEHSGSSPLVRGAPTETSCLCTTEGIIPARAGSTWQKDCRSPAHRDHPRSCGEHPSVLFQSIPLLGSSPLVRGALGLGNLLQFSIGIIPARAGSTHTGGSDAGRDGDHPRSCGEHLPTMFMYGKTMGSSPLVRGALLNQIAIDGVARIIPARAGSTRHRQAEAARSWDHPRSCGEHFCALVWLVRPAGSSPLVRGALGQKVLDALGLGIIPARAGSTSTELPGSPSQRDHPRSCGEHC